MLSLRFKVFKEIASLTYFGRQFHADGPACDSDSDTF